MAKVVITVVCALGIASAFAALYRWRDTAAATVGPDHPDQFRSRIREAIRQLSATAAAGLVAGLLTIGLGGRLMMRILAATSPDAAGRLTDAEEVVGEVTVGGSVFLIVFLGYGLGVTGALLFNLFRRWLPSRSLVAGVLASGIAGWILILPSGFLDPGNRDFEILEPTWLAIVLCISVIVLSGATIATLVDRWVAIWPEPSRSAAGLAGLLPLIVIAPPPFVIFAIGFTALKSIRWPGSAERPQFIAWGRRLLLASCVAGGAWIGLNAGRILVG